MYKLEARKAVRRARRDEQVAAVEQGAVATQSAFNRVEAVGKDGQYHTAGEEASDNAKSDLKAAGVKVNKDGDITHDDGKPVGSPTPGVPNTPPEDETLDPQSASAVAEGAPAFGVNAATGTVPADLSPFATAPAPAPTKTKTR